MSSIETFITDLISFDLAAKLAISLSCLSLLYHFLIISRVINYNAVWGGRLKSVQEMYRFEMVSVAINIIFVFAICLRADYISLNIGGSILSYFMILFAILFLINTLGNIVSKNKFEAIVFSPMTLVLAILCFRLAIG